MSAAIEANIDATISKLTDSLIGPGGFMGLLEGKLSNINALVNQAMPLLDNLNEIALRLQKIEDIVIAVLSVAIVFAIVVLIVFIIRSFHKGSPGK